MTVKVFHVKHNLQGDTSHPWDVLRTPPGIQASGLELGPSPSRCAAGDPLPLPGPARRPARGPQRPWSACQGFLMTWVSQDLGLLGSSQKTENKAR